MPKDTHQSMTQIQLSNWSIVGDYLIIKKLPPTKMGNYCCSPTEPSLGDLRQLITESELATRSLPFEKLGVEPAWTSYVQATLDQVISSTTELNELTLREEPELKLSAVLVHGSPQIFFEKLEIAPERIDLRHKGISLLFHQTKNHFVSLIQKGEFEKASENGKYLLKRGAMFAQIFPKGGRNSGLNSFLLEKVNVKERQIAGFDLLINQNRYCFKELQIVNEGIISSENNVFKAKVILSGLNREYEGTLAIDLKQSKLLLDHGKLFTAGESYEGDFKNNLPEGEGKSVYANGDKYEGQYMSGKRHGKGKYSFKKDAGFDDLQCEWQSGVAVGYGHLNGYKIKVQSLFPEIFDSLQSKISV